MSTVFYDYALIRICDFLDALIFLYCWLALLTDTKCRFY